MQKQRCLQLAKANLKKLFVSYNSHCKKIGKDFIQSWIQCTKNKSSCPMNIVHERHRQYYYEYSGQNIKTVLLETEQWEYKGSICHEYSKRNIGTSKKRINKRVRETTNFAEWSCTNQNNKLMRTLFFGRMVLHKEIINERKKIINFWSNGRALKKK